MIQKVFALPSARPVTGRLRLWREGQELALDRKEATPALLTALAEQISAREHPGVCLGEARSHLVHLDSFPQGLRQRRCQNVPDRPSGREEMCLELKTKTEVEK